MEDPLEVSNIFPETEYDQILNVSYFNPMNLPPTRERASTNTPYGWLRVTPYRVNAQSIRVQLACRTSDLIWMNIETWDVAENSIMTMVQCVECQIAWSLSNEDKCNFPDHVHVMRIPFNMLEELGWTSRRTIANSCIVTYALVNSGVYLTYKPGTLFWVPIPATGRTLDGLCVR